MQDHRRKQPSLHRLQKLREATSRLSQPRAPHQPEEDLLREAIEALTALIGARYGAIATLDRDGEFKKFIHAGITPEAAERIGRLPEGHGLLGAVARADQVVRLEDISRDPRSVGFPPGHPPMKSLLAAPIAHQGQVYGCVYLSEKAGGEPFSDDDEILASHYADALALALACHRSEAERARTEEMLRVVAHALSVTTGDEFFSNLVLTLSRALGMDYVFVGELKPGRPDTIRTIAFCDHGRTAENIDYPLAPQTPCGSVECKSVCHFPDGAAKLFPEDDLIYRYGVETFIGHPLLDSVGHVLGLLVVMHEKPIAGKKEQIQSLLQICAGRAAAELERRQDITGRKQADAQMRQLSSAIEQTADAVAITDRDGIIQYVNPAYEKITGYSRQEAIGKTPSIVKSGRHDPADYQRLWETILRGEVFRGVMINRRKGGELYHEQKTITPLKDEKGDVTHFVSTGKDITERVEAEQALRESETSLSNAQRIARLGNWDWDIVANKLRWSDEIYRIFGLTPRQFGATYEAFLASVHPDDRQSVIDAVNQALHEKQPYSIDHRIVLPDGAERIVHEQAEVTFGEDGKAIRMVGTVQDVTEYRQAMERLHYLANYDPLTGLPNRVLLQDRLMQALSEADRHERLAAVMFLDLDRFKIINDTLGHDVGDDLLKAVAERLTRSLRAGDTISRLGGDEFTIILANVAHVDDVARVARKIIDSFVPPFEVDRRELFVSPSIGIALYPFDDRSPENLLRNADAAMYHAKEMGRNTFQFYTAEINRRTAKRLALETALRHAIERNELLLHYQPQVSLKTGRIIGVEALVRWQHPEMGLVSPMEFIPLAEETGLIIPIGEWVLRTACQQAQAWHRAGAHHLQIAVNISGRQFQHQNLARLVKKVLKETGLDPRQLELELTESLLMHNTEIILTAMDELHAFGVVFSMDDFGTGYSSLSYLKRFPIDTLKIDRSFVRDIPRDADDVAIIQGIIAMAHSLGIRVIAEGVETARQLAFLRAHRSDAMQGYYFSKPVPADAMTRLLQRGRHLAPAKKPAARRKARRSKRSR